MGKVKESGQDKQQAQESKPFKLELIILKEAITNDNEVILKTTNTINR